ncbi:MAG: alpha/beta hydrolase [Planctomyces sp.]|nr:alpha/beta hydrolase [Planctomyces sp.]
MDVQRALLSFWMLILFSGCSLVGEKQFWCQPDLPYRQVGQTICAYPPSMPESSANELNFAAYCDRTGSPDATAHYLNALEQLWPTLESGTVDRKYDPQILDIYHRTLGRFLVCAQRHRQYVPGAGVVIHREGGTRTVPIRLIGLPWKPSDLQVIYPVQAYHADSLTRQVKRPGWGLPIVARRKSPSHAHPGEQFLLPDSTFSVTAILKTEAVAVNDTEYTTSQPVLEFYNPLDVTELSVAADSQPLAADFSAPFAFNEICGTSEVDPFEWFIHPEMDDGETGLFFLDPWQPGKIPVVLIHGLLSSPRTWVNMASELRSIPGFSDRYQIWGFHYATGQPFFNSAAKLRGDLNVALAELKQNSNDPALDHIVLIGHSMGGLIAKAQISYSNDYMWQAIANRPLSNINADHASRNKLYENFYFAPQPSVRRAIFIAVPHRGSTLATRVVGQIGSTLVQPDPRVRASHRQLVANNPGVFSREVRYRIPTSIDLLKSDSTLLRTLYCLPVNNNVRMHSIIGDGRLSIGDGRGDGVVGITSARHPGVDSELYVPTTHTEIHGRPETVCEVWRILSEHHSQYLNEISPQVVPDIPATTELNTTNSTQSARIVASGN